MKKFIILASIFTVFAILIFGVSVKAQGSDPLALIWDWIGRLRERVTILEEEVANIELIPGPEGPQGPVGSPGPAGQQLHLYDANGQDLGIFIDADTMSGQEFSYRTYFPSLNIIPEFRSNISALVNLLPAYNPNGFYFQSGDCTGIAYMDAQPLPHALYKMAYGPRYFRASNESIYQGAFIRPMNSRYTNICTGFPATNVLSYLFDEITLPFIEPIVWPVSIQ